METFTFNIDIVRWVILGLGTVIWLYTTNKAVNRPGWLSGIDGIVPTFWYLVFVILWLIVFLGML